MKIAVIGAGAMGSLFGGLLAEAGHEVWLCDIWEDHIQVVTQHGLMIEDETNARQIRLNAGRNARSTQEDDKGLVTGFWSLAAGPGCSVLSTYQLPEARSQWPKTLAPDTWTLTPKSDGVQGAGPPTADWLLLASLRSKPQQLSVARVESQNIYRLPA